MAAPKLRFKEFDGDWSETLFQDLFIFKNGVNASKEQYGSGIKFINVLDIINNPNGITYDSIIGSVNITSKEIDKNLVKYGDVLFQRSSETREEVGQSNVYLGKDPVVFGGFVIRGSAQKEYDPIFMNGLLKTDSLRDQITQLSGGSTRFNIGQDSLNKVSAYLPLKEEQTKIASFLSAVDEKISQLTQKHELLSQYKQGMMQKLFSQQLRFKADDGSEFGEWKSVFLGDISKPQQWKTISSSELTEIGYPVFGANGYIGFYPKYNHINETIAVTCRGATCGEVTLVKAKSYITGNAMSIDEINENEHSTLYIYYALCFRGFKDVISGSAQPQIVGNAIRKVTFQIPCLEEQTKIANFLSAIDRKIEVVAQQIEQAKTWKKGLLQQMFV
ncbi:restriction endonuclease subunit S [Acinetobacter baumannii]|nr:restriction endonuclease subunit S [Acinetobacter baumannii]MDC5508482.1 restriction endonuclease subunit S [Acinetobacter baumannii]